MEGWGRGCKTILAFFHRGRFADGQLREVVFIRSRPKYGSVTLPNIRL